MEDEYEMLVNSCSYKVATQQCNIEHTYIVRGINSYVERIVSVLLGTSIHCMVRDLWKPDWHRVGSKQCMHLYRNIIYIHWSINLFRYDNILYTKWTPVTHKPRIEGPESTRVNMFWMNCNPTSVADLTSSLVAEQAPPHCQATKSSEKPRQNTEGYFKSKKVDWIWNGMHKMLIWVWRWGVRSILVINLNSLRKNI